MTVGRLHPYDLQRLKVIPDGEYPSSHQVRARVFRVYLPLFTDPWEYSTLPLDTSGRGGQFATKNDFLMLSK